MADQGTATERTPSGLGGRTSKPGWTQTQEVREQSPPGPRAGEKAPGKSQLGAFKARKKAGGPLGPREQGEVLEVIPRAVGSQWRLYA